MDVESTPYEPSPLETSHKMTHVPAIVSLLIGVDLSHRFIHIR